MPLVGRARRAHVHRRVRGRRVNLGDDVIEAPAAGTAGDNDPVEVGHNVAALAIFGQIDVDARALLICRVDRGIPVPSQAGVRGILALKVGERFLLVQADEVIFASLADDVITVVAGKHTGTSSCRTLDELQEQLDPGIFWRVHRSHLVNINKVKEIVPWFNRNYILRMKDEKATEIPVSRNHTRRLREYLKL